MNKEHISYYYTLGLQPGASSAEIKSAFRRLVKLYHADHDQSLDAEMKYREIQTAYKELLRQASAGGTATAPNSSKQTTQTTEGTTAWPRAESQQQTQRVTWSEEDADEFFYQKSESSKHVTFKMLFLGFFTAFALTSFWGNVLVCFIVSFIWVGGLVFLVKTGVISKEFAEFIAIFCPGVLAGVLLVIAIVNDESQESLLIFSLVGAPLMILIAVLAFKFEQIKK